MSWAEFLMNEYNVEYEDDNVYRVLAVSSRLNKANSMAEKLNEILEKEHLINGKFGVSASMVGTKCDESDKKCLSDSKTLFTFYIENGEFSKYENHILELLDFAFQDLNSYGDLYFNKDCTWGLGWEWADSKEEAIKIVSEKWLDLTGESIKEAI